MNRYTFRPCRVRVEIKTFCPTCKKKLKRVLSRTCYDNGLHSVSNTMATYRKELDKEQRALEKKGVVCAKCSK